MYDILRTIYHAVPMIVWEILILLGMIGLLLLMIGFGLLISWRYEDEDLGQGNNLDKEV